MLLFSYAISRAICSKIPPEIGNLAKDTLAARVRYEVKELGFEKAFIKNDFLIK